MRILAFRPPVETTCTKGVFVKLMRNGAVLAALVGGIVLAGGGVASADSHATGAVFGSPGVLSGNLVQVPIDESSNFCGNTFNVIAALNPTFGAHCINGSHHSSDGRKFGGPHLNAAGGHMRAFGDHMSTPDMMSDAMMSDAMNGDDCD